MAHYYPVSIPYHGQALNITVQSYAGKMYWALTACRRALPQAEAYELIANLKLALKEIEQIATLHEAQPAAAAAPKPAEAPVKKVAAPRKRVAAKAPGKKVAAKAPRKGKTSAAATAAVKTPAPAAKARRASAGARAAR